MNQRGFISLGLTGYLAIAAGAVILTLGVALKWQSSRLETCHIERATEKARFNAKLAEFDTKLAEQNTAIEEWQGKAATTAQASRQALEKARVEGRSLQAEADRLRAQVGKSTPSGCPAGEAVKRVREGLVK